MLGPSSHFDRELGLGSLERVELLARLEAEFAIRLPDRVAAEINTPEELTEAILAAPEKSAQFDEAPSALRASITTDQRHRAAPDEDIFTTQTLIDVLRYRALHDADRTHLHITEDSDTDDKTVTLTFAELYSAAQSCAAELARRGETALRDLQRYLQLAAKDTLDSVERDEQAQIWEHVKTLRRRVASLN